MVSVFDIEFASEVAPLYSIDTVDNYIHVDVEERLIRDPDSTLSLVVICDPSGTHLCKYI